MNTIDRIFDTRMPAVSFEIFPPKGELTMDAARGVVGDLAALGPDFISVTCSAGGSGNGSGGATAAIAAMIQDEHRISSVAHLTCVSATEESLSAAIDDMRTRGVSSVLALRGDLVEGQSLSPRFRYAKDIIPALKDAGFCVGAAAYPEGHITCGDDGENIRHLKEKQDAGADFLVTQLAFENDCILRFLDRAQAAGIDVPITCGIMPFLSKSQIQRMVFMCGVSLPASVIKLLARYEGDAVSLRRAGIEFACAQLAGLAEAGVRGLHVYCMNSPDIAVAAMAALR